MASPHFVFAGEEADEELVPFVNEPLPAQQPGLGTLDEWLTPQDQAFSAALRHSWNDAAQHELEITGSSSPERRADQPRPCPAKTSS
jgi:hypothetical protein